MQILSRKASPHKVREEPVTALFTEFHLIPPDNHLNNDCWEMSLKESTTMGEAQRFYT